jgi:hypothetical protein
MQPITITTILDENHELFLKLKLPDMPPGPVEVFIVSRPVEDILSPDPETRRKQMRAKLIAAGHLSNARRSPDAQELSQEERERLWKQAANGKTALEFVNEDREERF